MSLSRFFFVFFKKRSRLYRFIKYDFCTIILMLFGLLLFGWTTKVWFDGLIFKTIVQSLI